jgi:hypothetical protein
MRKWYITNLAFLWKPETGTIVYNRGLWAKFIIAYWNKTYYPDSNDLYNHLRIRIGKWFKLKTRWWKLTENEVRQWILEIYENDDDVAKFFNNVFTS